MDRELLLSSLDEKIASLDKACLEAKKLKHKLIRLKDELLKGEPNPKQNFIILTNLFLPSTRLWTNQVCHDGIKDAFTYDEALVFAANKHLKIPSIDDYMELIRCTEHIYVNANIGKFKNYGNDNYVIFNFNTFYVVKGGGTKMLCIDHNFRPKIHYNLVGEEELFGNLLLTN